MSLELIRETFKANRIVGRGEAQTIFENDIIVPDSKPDIARVLLADGDLFITGTEILQDRVIVNGAILYKILYITDDEAQAVKGINNRFAFTYDLEVENARSNMKSKIKCNIEHIDYEILNGRKLNVKTVLNFSGRVEEETEQSLVYDLDGIDDIQVLKRSISANCFIGSGTADTSINESMEVPAGKPAIGEILRTDCKLSGTEYKIVDGKIIAKGEANVTTLYVADDEARSLQVMEHGIPFSQTIDLPGISEESSCHVDYRIADASFEAEEDSDGELRYLKCEMELKLAAEAYQQRNIEFIDDAYSPKTRISIDKEAFKMQEYTAESISQAVLKDTIYIDDDSPDIAEVFNAYGIPAVSDYEISEDRITIEGFVGSRIMYLANNAQQPVYICEKELPFRHVAEMKGIKPDMSCDINLDIEHCNYSMLSSKEIEVRFVVNVSSRAVNELEIPAIGKAAETALDDKRLASRPSITIYFTQPGDTLWKIAKNYYTTIADIQRINNISDQDLAQPGLQLIIPKRA